MKEGLPGGTLGVSSRRPTLMLHAAAGEISLDDRRVRGDYSREV
jgi:hypothetical protein